VRIKKKENVEVSFFPRGGERERETLFYFSVFLFSCFSSMRKKKALKKKRRASTLTHFYFLVNALDISAMCLFFAFRIFFGHFLLPRGDFWILCLTFAHHQVLVLVSFHVRTIKSDKKKTAAGFDI